MPKVLAILVDGFEEIEAVTPIDLLRRAGVEVTIATLGAPRTVTGRCGIALQGECSLGDALSREPGGYDCLLLPGGPGVNTLRESTEVIKTVNQQHAAGRLVAAICAAPLVLLEAGILEGRRYTAHGSVVEELPNILPDEAVVVDGNIVTSRGAGTALQFGLTLAELIVGTDGSQRIAGEIHQMPDKGN